MQKQIKRRQSFYDQNGFKTEQFELNIIKYLINQEELSQKQNRWKQILPKIKQFKQKNQRQLIQQVRAGIPDSLRKDVWPQLIMKPIKPYQFYNNKIQLKQIDLDLNRTFPNNIKVKQLTSKMSSVLNAIAQALPQLGYCQGMNFISAIILLKLDQQQAFNMMFHIFHWQKHQNLLQNLDQIHKKMYILDKLIKKSFPQLHKTLSNWQIDCLFYAAPWFITLFCNTLPCPYVLRLLQIYLLQGQKVLYRAALQMLKIKKKKLKQLSQFQEIMNQLKNFQDLMITQKQINNFFDEMFKIQLSRKQIQFYEKQYTTKLIKRSPEKNKK